MPRFVVVLLGAVVALGLVSWSAIVAPVALASSATAVGNAELRAGPSADATVLAVAPHGSVLSIDGPPQADYYPVTYAGIQGWAAAGTLDIAKDAPPPAGEGEVAAAPLVPADPVEVPPTATAAVASDAAPPPEATSVPTAVPSTEPTPAANDVVQLAPAAAQPTGTSTPTPIPSATAAAASTPTATTDSTATPTPGATMTPTPAPGPTGPATATIDLNLHARPSDTTEILFLIPAGSTVTQTGSTHNGFVSVDYMGIVGWASAEFLETPAPVAAEPTPSATPVDDVRTPRPGSGVAFTTVPLALRTGPSANEDVITTIPAETRVELTGVSENGYHRVAYDGQIGWVAIEYLSLPADPTPEAEHGGRGGGREQPTYTRDEIVEIIEDAADRYDQPRDDMVRVATCESNLDPYAVNPSGSYGLFQFIRSTWETTPYADYDIFDPWANANAAGWMWSVGRRSEWVCQ